MPPIEYRTTDIREIELIHPLWMQLNMHHHAKANTFRSHYELITFEDRKLYFEKIAAAGTLRIDLAFDSQDCRYIGYCISSLSQELAGEIESIFVEEASRSRGVGTTLVSRAIAWLDAQGSIRNRVSVGEGNGEVCGFYRKFGFRPRMTVLEQTKE